MTAPEILKDPQYNARGFIDQTEHPDAGSYRHPGLSWRFSSAPTLQGQRAPLFAEHTDWIVNEMLDIPYTEILEMQNEAVIPLTPIERT